MTCPLTNQKVLIIDEYTGRIMHGRRFSDGLHQSLESKENSANLDLFGNLNSVGGALVIMGNSELTNLDGLSELITIPGDFEINNNDTLTNIDGISQLETIGGLLLLYIAYKLYKDVIKNNISDDKKIKASSPNFFKAIIFISKRSFNKIISKN